MCQVLLHTAAGRERVQLGPRVEAVELLWPRIRELAPPLKKKITEDITSGFAPNPANHRAFGSDTIGQ